jgi:hypothetical protein
VVGEREVRIGQFRHIGCLPGSDQPVEVTNVTVLLVVGQWSTMFRASLCRCCTLVDIHSSAFLCGMSIVVQTLHFGGHELLHFRAAIKNREVAATSDPFYPFWTITRSMPALESSKTLAKERSGGMPINEALGGQFRSLSLTMNFQIGSHISLVLRALPVFIWRGRERSIVRKKQVRNRCQFFPK